MADFVSSNEAIAKNVDAGDRYRRENTCLL